ncbi:MAG: tetratricopeptide repeat protein [Sphingobacteriia bacterium]|nr:tetratricopeptide repeat protein [Sphingobacteriia bacterium]
MDQLSMFGKLFIRQFLIIVFCFLSEIVFAERVDSLRNATLNGETESDRLHAKCLLAVELMPDSMEKADLLLNEAAPLLQNGSVKQIANYYNFRGLYHWYAGNSEEAIIFFKKTLSLPEHSLIMKDRAMAANNAGTLFRMQGKIDSAKIFLHQALDIDIHRNYLPGIAKTKYDLAVLYDRSSQYHLAMKYILEAVGFQEEATDTIGLVLSYNVLGNVYVSLDLIERAAYYYKKGLTIAERKEMTNHKITYINNLISLMAAQPDSLPFVLSYFQQGIFLAEKNQDLENLVALHGNMGRAYDAVMKYDQASSFYSRGLKYLEQLENSVLKADFLFFYSSHLFKTGQIELADDYLHQTLSIAEDVGEMSRQAAAYRLMASVDSINGNYKDAFDKFQRSVAIRDSIFTLKKIASIAEMQAFHDIARYERTLSTLESENRFCKLRLILVLIAGFTIVVFLSFLLFYFGKHKKIAEKNYTIKELEHSKLQIQFESNRQDLTGKAMALMNSERVIKKLQSEMKTYVDQLDDDGLFKLQPVMNTLKTEDKSKELWKDFENRFNELNDGFIAKLTTKHPDLSPAEIRLCAMLRLQIPSKEISKLTQRSLRTIEQSRFKIRKKIGLNSGDNLVNYLLKI